MDRFFQFYRNVETTETLDDTSEQDVDNDYADDGVQLPTLSAKLISKGLE